MNPSAESKYIRFAETGISSNLTSLPGNRDICVSHSVHVPEILRGRGIGSEAHENRLAVMRGREYEYAICTVDTDNVPQIKILEKYGWHLLDSFDSECTGHNVSIYGRQLDDQKTEEHTA